MVKRFYRYVGSEEPASLAHLFFFSIDQCAEYWRFSMRDFARYLAISLGSLGEAETRLRDGATHAGSSDPSYLTYPPYPDI